MKSLHSIMLFSLLLLAPATRAADYIIGADLSFLSQAESQGTSFKDNNIPTPGLQIFKNHGYNWIRLRLFNDPAAAGRAGRGLPNNLDYTVKLAQDAKKLGYKFLLDFHYADSWADPAKQPIPAAWQNMSHEQRVTALHNFTCDTLLAFHKADAFPDMVQLGNEITNGMLWPDAQLYGQGRGGDTAAGKEAWDHFADFLKAGAQGVAQGTPPNAKTPRIMIHIDKGGDKRATQFFFDKILSYQIPFDAIGQSYYPWWHGSLLDLRENLQFMATTYRKDIVLAEVAYNWRPAEYRTAPAPFPESPEGQKAFLEAVNQLVLNTPDNKGIGIFWWEPAVSPRNGIASRGMFDNEANALPVINTFDAFTRGKTPPPPARGRGRNTSATSQAAPAAPAMIPQGR